MTIQLARLLTSFRSRSQWNLANHISRRYVQEFPGMRCDNSSHTDYMIVMPETIDNIDQNELLRVPRAGEPEIQFSKLNPEICYKGLSHAICAFEDFITDVNNQTRPPHESLGDLFKDVEKNLFPLDSAYNILMVLLTLKARDYRHLEIHELLQRYTMSRNRKIEGQFKKLLQQMTHINKENLSSNERKLLKIYKISTRKSENVLPFNENLLVAHRDNILNDMRLFAQNVHLANQQFSHTVDDPDILAAVAEEFDDCHDLHHKERTPLRVDATTYHRFMRVCPDRFVRQLLWQTYNKRCSPKGQPKQNNLLISSNIRLLKRKMADMAGYRSYLDLRLQGTMASSRDRIVESLDAIDRENSPKLAERLRELSDYAETHSSFSDADQLGLREYDLSFWLNKYVHDVLIGVGEAELKKFFPFENVMQGLRNYFRTYFSIEFKTEVKSDDSFWSGDVQFIEISRRGQPMGRIIYSPYQKPDGRGGTYYARLRSRVQGAAHLPARLIGTSFNVDDSTGQAHLSFPEVMTLFGCFSTVIQRLMYDYPYYELNANGGLEADVIGLFPNLCLAHLLTDHKIIQSCSIRGGSKPIDSELASRIVNATRYSTPFKIWFDLYKAHLDLDVHSKMTSTKNLVDELYIRYSPFERDQDNFDFCTMNEIFLGPNDGLQYGDLWSKQLANFCLSQVQDSKGKIDDQKAIEMFGKLVDSLFSAEDLTTEDKLTSLTGQRFEPSKLGLGVL